jgi:hypothetical protein
LHLLLTLPDQSRGLIPADWTDFAAGSGSGKYSRSSI